MAVLNMTLTSSYYYPPDTVAAERTSDSGIKITMNTTTILLSQEEWSKMLHDVDGISAAPEEEFY